MFEKSRVGDKVYSRMHGFGRVIKTTQKFVYVHFQGYKLPTPYEISGFPYRRLFTCAEPVLFYVDGNNRYATERPTHRLHASMLPVDTPLKVWDHYEHYANIHHFKDFCSGEYGISCWMNGSTSFTAENSWGYSWKHAKLVQDLTVTIEGLTHLFPAGTEVDTTPLPDEDAGSELPSMRLASSTSKATCGSLTIETTD